MLYVPPISDYKSFYIQFATGNAIDIKNTYSVVVKTHDYPSEMKVKEPYKNQWKDEHGDDEYIGAAGLYAEAFTFRMECVMFANGNTARADLEAGVTAFEQALRSGGLFKTYDAWTEYGFKDVRLSEFPKVGEKDFYKWTDGVRVIFSVVLKVNDPITHMVLSNNQIVEG